MANCFGSNQPAQTVVALDSWSPGTHSYIPSGHFWQCLHRRIEGEGKPLVHETQACLLTASYQNILNSLSQRGRTTCTLYWNLFLVFHEDILNQLGGLQETTVRKTIKVKKLVLYTYCARVTFSSIWALVSFSIPFWTWEVVGCVNIESSSSTPTAVELWNAGQQVRSGATSPYSHKPRPPGSEIHLTPKERDPSYSVGSDRHLKKRVTTK